MRIRDIEPLTPWGNYQIDVAWKYLESQISSWEEDYGLDLDPDFQRPHVWDMEKRVKYVEFCLRGGRSSRTLLFNSAGFEGMQRPEEIILVDGKQRLESVRMFLRDELKAFGHYLSEYSDGLDMCRDRFTFMVNNLPTRSAVLKWYLELNDGGVVHTKEEIEKVREMYEKELKNASL